MSSNSRSPAVENILAAGAGVAGALLSLLLVDLSLGLLDGFGTDPLRRVGLRLEDGLPWLPLAALGALALGLWYRRLLAGKGGALDVLLAFFRPFLHFPLFGMAVLLAMLWGACAGLVNGLLDRSEGLGRGVDFVARKVGEGIAARIALPLWFLLPLPAARVERKPGLPPAPSRRRMLRALPLLALLFLLFPGMESEDSGERVNSLLVTVAGSIWFADYLLVAVLVVPRLRQKARESDGQAGPKQA